MKNILYALLLLPFISCQKIDGWLDVRSKNSDVVLSTLEDFQSLLDNTSVMNITPSLGIISADNITLVESVALNNGNISERNAYIWKEDIYEGIVGIAASDWSIPFKAIAYANIVIEGVTNIKGEESQRKNVWGSALFFRAFHYYQLLQVYAPPYNSRSADLQSALPLRFTSDVDVVGRSANLGECYQQIIEDLTQSIELLPELPVHKTRPSRLASLALLAKVYLDMGDYDRALVYSNQFLEIYDELLPFSALDAGALLPFPTMDKGHAEVIFYSSPITYSFVSYGSLLVDESLFSTYADNDLRKQLFFRVNSNGTKSFKGRYTGTVSLFSGLAVNEIWLINSECLARTGYWEDAKAMLIDFCNMRYVNYQLSTAENQEFVLRHIFDERRKELVFTGSCRWQDLRRLNQDERFAQTLSRSLAGNTYTLPPNDSRYTLPVIPQELALMQKYNVR